MPGMGMPAMGMPGMGMPGTALPMPGMQGMNMSEGAPTASAAPALSANDIAKLTAYPPMPASMSGSQQQMPQGNFNPQLNVPMMGQTGGPMANFFGMQGGSREDEDEDEANPVKLKKYKLTKDIFNMQGGGNNFFFKGW